MTMESTPEKRLRPLIYGNSSSTPKMATQEAPPVSSQVIPLSVSEPDSETHGHAEGRSVMQNYVDVCTKHLDPYEDTASLATCASLDLVPPLSQLAVRDFFNAVADHTGVTIQRWLSRQDVATLRINGPSGSGKAFLACTIVQSLRYWVQGPIISYNIPPARPVELFTARGVLASLCQEALLQFPNAGNIEDLCAFLLDDPDAILSKDIFRAILCSLVASLSSETVFCIITGIENLEDSHRSDLIKDLDIIMSHTEPSFSRFKLLVTTNSRQTPELTCPQEVVRLDQSPSFCKFLMQTFLDRKLLLLAEDHTVPPIWKLLEMSRLSFSNWLLNSSENMTDLALKVDILQHSPSFPARNKEDAVKLVSQIQNPLSQHYATLLRDLPTSGPGVSRLSLIWILFSMEPLRSWDLSICNALSVDGYDAMRYTASRPVIDAAILDSEHPICSLRASPLGRVSRFSNDELHLSHGPRHYDALIKVLQSGDGIPPQEAHLFLFSQCLSFLTTMLASTSSTSNRYGAPRHWTFFRYSVLYWPEHCRRAYAENIAQGGEVAQKVIQFLQNETLFQEWKRFYNQESYRVLAARLDLDGTTSLESPLEVATYFKLDKVFDLLRRMPVITTLSASHAAARAIRIAISNGNEPALEVLQYQIPKEAARQLASRGHDFSVVHHGVYQQVVFGDLTLRGHSAHFLKKKNIPFLLSGIDQPSSSGSKGLHLATRVGSLELVNVLVEWRVSNMGAVNEYVNSCDNMGNSSLMYAADGGFYQIAHFLLEGHIEARNGMGQSQVYRFTVDVNKANNDGDTALHLAVRRGAAKVVSLLLSHNVRTNIPNSRGETLLHLACRQSSLRLVRSYFDVIRSQNQRTGHSEVGVFRLALLARDNAGNTPLHVAAAHGNADFVNFFLHPDNPDHRPIVDLPNNFGKTPLHLAARAGHLEICDSLLHAGAFMLALDTEGSNPIDCAKKRGHEKVVELFESLRSA
ncbi:hypothetical protein V8F20_002680 [Naviculisporaceae sp. PSN 640]